MKNGRFSGKNTSNLWLTVTCGSSDSTWLKSGFTVMSTVSASLTTALPSTPARAEFCVTRTPSSPRTLAVAKSPYGMILEVPSGRDALQPFHGGHLLAEARDAPRDVGPERGLVRARNDPTHGHAPRLRRRVAEAEALERDLHHDDVAVRGQAAVRLPQGVVAEIVVLALRRDAIQLDAERVHDELVRPSPVVVGIQEDRDHVVAQDRFALRHVRADLGRVVLADEDRVQVPLVVREVRRGLDRRRDAVAGLPLHEARDRDSWRRRLPVEVAGQHGRVGDPGDGDGRLLRSCSRRRTGDGAQQQDSGRRTPAHMGSPGNRNGGQGKRRPFKG